MCLYLPTYLSVYLTCISVHPPTHPSSQPASQTTCQSTPHHALQPRDSCFSLAYSDSEKKLCCSNVVTLQVPKTDSFRVRSLNRFCVSRNSKERSACSEIRSQRTRGLCYADETERIPREIKCSCWSRWLRFSNIYENSSSPCFISPNVTSFT